MDYARDNVVHVIETNGPENWLPNAADSSVWATEEDYRLWEADTPSNSYDQRQQQPNKKARNSQEASSRSKAIGKMFFKTKLCCKFRAGTCPYVTNCNFAHSIEELRRPPANWQEIVAAHEEDKGIPPEVPREEFQIPSVGTSAFAVETQRTYKWRHCKKFFTEEGCPYGENCTFLHDEQSKNRESVAISLGPGGYGGGGGGGGVGGGNGPNSKPTNWKTRICNKWELTGYCPFGIKCHFAHGAAELNRYGGPGDGEATTSPASESKQGGAFSKSQSDAATTLAPPLPHSDIYHSGIPSQRTSISLQRPGQRPHQKWKGPDKISRIYGDWIDDFE